MGRMQSSKEKTEHYRETARVVDGAPKHRGNGIPVEEKTELLVSDSMTREMALPVCPRANWRIDPSTILPFDRAEVAHGTEEFRALRSRLCQVQAQSRLRSLLVASAVPGEGRSFVAANLAQVLALQADSRVLLIDGDLRNPRLHAALGTSQAPGLTEYLLQEVDELSVMQRGDADNLYFIPCGRSANAPTELIATGRLKHLMDRVEPLFDWIIMDSPPAVATSDACLLANYCDQVLMVVRGNSTPFDIVRKAQRRFRQESLLGVVLNVIKDDLLPSVGGSGQPGSGGAI
jgi:capsular exopolysaccharide synthesis family protein